MWGLTLRDQGEVGLASALNTQLLGLLENASTNDHKAQALSALGNAGLKDNVPTIVEHATSDSADVRRAVTRSLRKTQTDEAETAVLLLASDKDDAVQRSALETLEGWRLEPSHLAALEQKLQDGELKERAQPTLTRLLAREMRGDDETKAATSRRMLEQMMDGPLPTKLRYQVGGLLKGQRGLVEQTDVE